MTIKISKSPNYVLGQSFKISGNPAAGGVGIGKNFSGGGGGGGGGNNLVWTVNGSVHASYDPASLPALPASTTLETSFDIGTITSAGFSGAMASYIVFFSPQSISRPLSSWSNIVDYYKYAGVPSGGTDDIIIIAGKTELGKFTISGMTNSTGATLYPAVTWNENYGGENSVTYTPNGKGNILVSELDIASVTSGIISTDHNELYYVILDSEGHDGEGNPVFPLPQHSLPFDLAAHYVANGVPADALDHLAIRQKNTDSWVVVLDIPSIIDSNASPPLAVYFSIDGANPPSTIGSSTLTTSLDVTTLTSAVLTCDNGADYYAVLASESYGVNHSLSAGFDLVPFYMDNGAPSGGFDTIQIRSNATNAVVRSLDVSGIVAPLNRYCLNDTRAAKGLSFDQSGAASASKVLDASSPDSYHRGSNYKAAYFVIPGVQAGDAYQLNLSACGSTDANTKLLINMDGTNGSTSFVDNSYAPKPITAFGNAQISTSVSKFGGSSGYFDGSGDYLRIPYSTDFNLSSGNFTLECWFQANSFGSVMTLLSKDTYGSHWDWDISILNNTTFHVWSTSGPVNTELTVTVPAMSTGTWYHVALVRNSGTNTLYLDGVAYGSNSMTISNLTTTKMTVGCASWNNPQRFFNGYLDDVRISKSARYTGNFTPPTSQLPVANDFQYMYLLSGSCSNDNVLEQAGELGATGIGPGGVLNGGASNGGASIFHAFDSAGDYNIECTTYAANKLGSFSLSATKIALVESLLKYSVNGGGTNTISYYPGYTNGTLMNELNVSTTSVTLLVDNPANYYAKLDSEGVTHIQLDGTFNLSQYYLDNGIQSSDIINLYDSSDTFIESVQIPSIVISLNAYLAIDGGSASTITNGILAASLDTTTLTSAVLTCDDGSKYHATLASESYGVNHSLSAGFDLVPFYKSNGAPLGGTDTLIIRDNVTNAPVKTLSISGVVVSLNAYCLSDTRPAKGLDISGLSVGQYASTRGQLTTSSPISPRRPGRYAEFIVLSGAVSGASYRIDLISDVDATDPPQGNPVDTYMYLLSGPCSDASTLWYDDDGGGNGQSRINYTFSNSGNYSVECTTWSSNVTGYFQLKVTRTG